MKSCTKCQAKKTLDQFYSSKAECKSCFNARPRNKERERRNLKEWRARNPERRREQDARWRAANPDGVRARNARRHRLRAEMTEDDRIYIGILLGDPCAYCGGKMEHLDHIDPVSLSGDSSWLNLTAACSTCNWAKSNKSLLQFLVDR